MKPVKYTKAQYTARMVTPEKYECEPCEGTGKTEDGDALRDCEPCDGIGITAIDCPGCNREAVPIHETVFVAAYPQTYCEPCGDRELERLCRPARSITRMAKLVKGRQDMNRPTDKQVDEQHNQATRQIDIGVSRWPGQTYEDGVDAAIRWMRGETDDVPMPDE